MIYASDGAYTINCKISCKSTNDEKKNATKDSSVQGSHNTFDIQVLIP